MTLVIIVSWRVADCFYMLDAHVSLLLIFRSNKTLIYISFVIIHTLSFDENTLWFCGLLLMTPQLVMSDILSLSQVSEEYKLVPDTLYLTVYLIDRFLSRNYIERQRLQLLGITSMLVASWVLCSSHLFFDSGKTLRYIWQCNIQSFA